MKMLAAILFVTGGVHLWGCGRVQVEEAFSERLCQSRKDWTKCTHGHLNRVLKLNAVCVKTVGDNEGYGTLVCI